MVMGNIHQIDINSKMCIICEMDELHLTKKDFKIEWFSGTGGGGQYRNKHQNCCRLTHIASGITTVGQTERDRSSNQAKAFKELAKRLIAYYSKPKERVNTQEVIRHYNEKRNEVIDVASGKRLSYKQVVLDGDMGELIELRRTIKGCESD